MLGWDVNAAGLGVGIKYPQKSQSPTSTINWPLAIKVTAHRLKPLPSIQVFVVANLGSSKRNDLVSLSR